MTRKLQEIGADEVLQVGGGVVGIIRNGDGRRVLFRADMDALPVTEATGLEYASTEPGRCTPAATTRTWRPRWVPPLFWPGTRARGPAPISPCSNPVRRPARVRRPWLTTVWSLLDLVKPDVCLAQHVLTVPVAGNVATRSVPVLSAEDSIRVTVFGKGSHGSMPHLGVDPAVLASSIVLRLQGSSPARSRPVTSVS